MAKSAASAVREDDAEDTRATDDDILDLDAPYGAEDDDDFEGDLDELFNGIADDVEVEDDDDDDDDDEPLAANGADEDEFARLSPALRARFEQAEQSRIQAEQQLAQARNDGLRHQRAAVQSNAAFLKTVVETTKQSLENIKQQLKAAQEDGETDKVVDLYQQMAATDRRLAEAQNAQAQVDRQLREMSTAAPTSGNQPPAGGQASSAANGNTPLANAWIAKNASWFNNQDPAYASIRQQVFQIDNELKYEGRLTPNDQAWFTELDNRLAQRLSPENRARIGLAAPSRRRSEKSKPTAGVSNGATRTAVRGGDGGGKGQIRLSKAQLRNMVKFGMDPKNKAHLRAYAASARSVSRGDKNMD